jgi:hypothetical protein
MTITDYNNNVFINCPFDDKYKEIFDSIVFCIFDCGFIARCTMEEQDASQIRIDKIYNIVQGCKYGIHDISRTELDEDTGLPRFNMPFELGIFLAAKRYGQNNQQQKKCLILDKRQYRYQQFISDISGQDIKAHENEPRKAVLIVRDWLRDASQRTDLPGGSVIWRDYRKFVGDLPSMCTDLNLKPKELIFNDYIHLVSVWLENKQVNNILSSSELPPI